MDSSPPTSKLHNVLIMRTKVPKSKHISNPTTNQTQIHKYIETYDVIKKHKAKQHQQIFTKQNTSPTNT